MFLVAGLSFYRSVVFTHEIAHRPPGTLPGFRQAWNLLCGIPLLVPSFLYGDHRSHHSTKSYGTSGDAEYQFLASGRSQAILFLLLSFVYPLLGPLRFMLLTIPAFLVPAIDRVVWRYASSLYMMNPDYERRDDVYSHSVARWAQEIACCLWAWSIAYLAWTGRVSTGTLIKTYAVFLFWMGLNQVRTLAAHHYSSDGTARSYVAQMLDSNTFSNGVFLPELWAPLGMRYHALHHILPSVPYHALAEAHRRLMQSLPLDSPYRATLQPGLWPVVINAVARRQS
jgi:fatty acid desaturase